VKDVLDITWLRHTTATIIGVQRARKMAIQQQTVTAIPG
jgi:hypothetical protein